ncbi:MAG: serine/threonine-protein kinase, partial [Alphaproteobacteria bacterium]
MLETVGKYRIEQFIGKGATGRVFLAVDPFSEREVAIKVMEEKPDADVEAARLQQRFFQTEAALAGKLRHPHIATILDAGIEGDTRYLVMEYIDGGSLAKHCDSESRLPVPKIVEIGFKCCKALEYANQNGVVHRDLKPANIMLTQDFDIKISDFGAAMVDRADITQVLGVGSPAYMSPEQIQGETLNFQTDIFSLGAVLYHVLTGRRPFNGETVNELIDQITEIDPPPPSAHRHDVPPALDKIIARAMAKSREQRFASWEELANRLEALLVAEAGDTLGLTEAERFNAMRRLSFFRTFSEVELWEVVRQASWRKFEANENLIHEGDHDEGFYVLASGMA